MIKTVTIIATGEELLQGTTVDRNSSFISSRFFGTNFKVLKHITTGDNADDIKKNLLSAIPDSDIVIITGGLGPTDDDNTVEALCSVFNTIPVYDETARDRMEKFFLSMNIQIRESDYKMISIPGNSISIGNPRGLAPGFIISSKENLVISLPGVPEEMSEIFDNALTDYLENNIGFSRRMNLSYKVCGIRESETNRIIGELNLPPEIKWGISAKQGISDLVFTCELENFINKNEIDVTIKDKFKDYLLDPEFTTPEEELLSLLGKRGYTISTAESCTGGLIGKKITDLPGASSVYSGTVTAYSNEAKTTLLDVDTNIIKTYGAVSEETAGAMAQGAAFKFNTSISVSTTGIAGPGGGSKEKPVGTVCFGFYINDKVTTSTQLIKGSRERVRIFSAIYAVNYLRSILKEQK
jgi:nicotinamide-nucleotide amidase